jgi:ATPases involved in chromosome partitioning
MSLPSSNFVLNCPSLQLRYISSKYDFILIDCPPNVGVFAVNALMASDGVIIPVDMSYLGLLGIRGIERAQTLI